MKKTNIITSITFGAVIFGLTVATLVAPKKDFSANENRTLKLMPKFTMNSLIKGEFATDYETYLSDQFVMRDEWIKIKTLSEMAMLKSDINGVYLADDNYLIEMHDENSSTEPIDIAQANSNADRLVSFINNNSNKLGKEHVKAMIVPTAGIILADKLPMYAKTFDQTSYINDIKDRIPENFIDVTDALSAHKKEYIFYRTDHHWTMLGAYYAYEKWASVLGVTPTKKDAFEISDTKDFKGTIYSKINYAVKTDVISTYENKGVTYKVTYEDNGNTSESLFSREHLSTKDKYQVYLDGNHSITKIETSVKNGKTLLLVKDSYANSFATLLAAHYETIYVVDFRYLRQSPTKLIEDRKVTDILVLYNAITFAKDGYSMLFVK